MSRLLLSLLLLLSLTVPAFAASDKWTTLSNCTYKASSGNDGDSFYITTATRSNILVRLYFVDTPETSDDPFLESRVEAQAAAFGITEPAVLRMGEAAEKFTKQLLAGKPVAITTRFHEARGRSKTARYYAFVTIGGKDLGELLVSNGLARVFGVKAERPGTRDEQQRLERLQAEAKASRRGAWGFAGK